MKLDSFTGVQKRAHLEWVTAESIKPPTCVPDGLRVNLALSRYLAYQVTGDGPRPQTGTPYCRSSPRSV